MFGYCLRISVVTDNLGDLSPINIIGIRPRVVFDKECKRPWRPFFFLCCKEQAAGNSWPIVRLGIYQYCLNSHVLFYDKGPTCLSHKAAAYERGLADRGRRADAEAVQLQEAAEKALEEVKQGARATIEEMSARHMDELEAEKRWVQLYTSWPGRGRRVKQKEVGHENIFSFDDRTY